MIRGGNIEFRFDLSYSFDDLAVVKILFWQENYNGPTKDRPLPIVKILEQCHPGDKPTDLGVTLNQEETLRFTDKRKAKVQLRAATKTGIPIITKQHLVSVYPSKDDSILDGEVWPTPTYDGWVRLDGESII